MECKLTHVQWITDSRAPGVVYSSAQRSANHYGKVSLRFGQVNVHLFLLGRQKRMRSANGKMWTRFEWCAMPGIGCQHRQQIDVYGFAMRIMEECQFYLFGRDANIFTVTFVWVCTTQFNYVFFFSPYSVFQCLWIALLFLVVSVRDCKCRSAHYFLFLVLFFILEKKLFAVIFWVPPIIPFGQNTWPDWMCTIRVWEPVASGHFFHKNHCHFHHTATFCDC